MSSSCVVVKVGGSLLDVPDLAARLTRSLADLPSVLLVPGGGRLTETLRQLDTVHGLGEETCHWLALQAMSINAGVLGRLLPDAQLVTDLSPRCAGWRILDPYPFFRDDDKNPDHLPHRWSVTSDSLALRAAVLMRAQELVLLKSVDWDGRRSWHEAAAAGVVDAYFPDALAHQQQTPAVRVVNLRAPR